jgi:hypothetical protein
MQRFKHVGLARSLGVLAVVSLPAFLWFGWETLLVSTGLAGVAYLMSPRPAHHGRRRNLRMKFEALQRRFRRHSWRPGHPR